MEGVKKVKVSILARCASYRGVRKERIDCMETIFIPCMFFC